MRNCDRPHARQAKAVSLQTCARPAELTWKWYDTKGILDSTISSRMTALFVPCFMMLSADTSPLPARACTRTEPHGRFAKQKLPGRTRRLANERMGRSALQPAFSLVQKGQKKRFARTAQ